MRNDLVVRIMRKSFAIIGESEECSNTEGQLDFDLN